MTARQRRLIQRSPLTLALAAALFLPVAHAQDQASQDQSAATADQKPKDLDKVTVTGIRGGIERAIDIKKDATSS